MEFRVLGPVELGLEGRTEQIAAGKERALLCLLLVEPNRVVSADRLIDELWTVAPPESAGTSLRVLVSRLRKTLAAFDTQERIVTRGRGYSIVVGTGELDVARFDALVAQGRSCLIAGDADGAAHALREADALWRGPAFVDVADLPLARAEAARLGEARLSALEDRVEADLAVGRHGSLVAELESLTTQNPLRERLWAARMLALYRSGRQADALRVYQQLRAHLGDELGIEPSPAVVALETSIIRQDGAIAWQPAGSTTSPSLATLPSGVVTFVLTDIVGSTPLWEAKPASMPDALSRHDELVAAIVAAHHGSFLRARGEGDSTFSVFARATDAAEAALEIQETIGREQWPDGIELRVRIALNTGETVERDSDYFGTTVNRAARLRSVAEPGQIIVSQSTAEVIADHLDGASLIELGEQELRGLRRPDRIYELRRVDENVDAAEHHIGEKYRPLLPPVLAAQADRFFVGRDDATAAVEARWQATVAGSRNVVLVAGEPGIGKTRLAAEFARTAHTAGATVLYGQCDEDLNVPLQPFAQAIRAYAAALPAPDRNRVVTAYGLDLARLVPELVPTRERTQENDMDIDRLRMFEAVDNVLVDESRRAPVLLVIDDLHWGAKSTMLLLRHLARSPESVPFMILGTYRDTDIDSNHPLGELMADLRRAGNVERVVLRGLDNEGVVSFMAAAAGQDLDESELDLASALHAGTEGNPFFLQEVLRHLVDTGAATRVDGRWRINVKTIDEVGLPEGVRDVITRRLSRFSEMARNALTVAALIGPAFSPRVLEAVLEMADGDDVLDVLDEAVRAGVLVDAAGRFAFSHALIRQTLGSALSSVRKARLHRRIGEAIERLPDASVEVDALAYHFGQAALDGVATKAGEYSLAACRQAMSRLAYEEAVTHAQNGLVLLDPESDDSLMGELNLAIADARRASGDLDGARSAALEAASIARRRASGELLMRCAVFLARHARVALRDEVAASTCEEALRLIPVEHVASRAVATAALASQRTYNEGGGTSPLADEAIELARASGDRAVIVDVLAMLVYNAFVGSTRAAEQRALASELIELCDPRRDGAALADAYMARFITDVALGDRNALESDLARLQTVATEHRLWLYLAIASGYEGMVALLDGRFAEVAAHGEAMLANGGQDANVATIRLAQLVELAREAKPRAELDQISRLVAQQRPEFVLGQVISTRLRAEQGDDVARSELLAFAADNFATVPRDLTWPGSLVSLAETAARTDSATVAELLLPHVERYSGTIFVLGRVWAAGAADRYVGVLASVLQRWDLAAASFEAALALESALEAPPFIARTKYWYARMLLARGAAGDAERAGAVLRDAYETTLKLGMPALGDDIDALMRR